MNNQEKQPELPRFRKDLILYKGPLENDGSPSFNLFDPVSGQYYKLDLTQALIIRSYTPGMTLEDLIIAINTGSNSQVTEEEIRDFYREAQARNFLAMPRTSEEVQSIAERSKTGIIKWLLFHYLYIRIPLINPDRFLERTLQYVRPLFSKAAVCTYAALSLIGIILVGMHFDEYLHTFTFFFNLEGLVLYAVCLTAVKVIHEFAHAYTAKYYRIHVPTMGVALIVLWPVMYTNVTDAWKLRKRSQRIAITIAGVAAELCLSGIATLCWALSEPGFFQSIAFIISSSTWLSTLAINLNPALRFDGYYLLCDLWGIDNLQQRAFDSTRWKLREWFLGFKVPPPEEDLSRKTLNWMIVYSVYTGIYRIVLYTAIAIFVYLEFTKALGIFLFIVEVIVFILWPFFDEFTTLFQMRSYFYRNTRLAVTSSVLGILLLWFVIPLPHTLSFSGITIPVADQVLYVPNDAVIKEILIKRGDRVKRNQVLALLSSKQLDFEIAGLETDKKILERTIQLYSLSDEDRPLLAQTAVELTGSEAQLQSLKEKQKRMTITAKNDGVVYALESYLHPGLPIAEGMILGKVADITKVKVIVFIPEQDIHAVSKNQFARFRLKNPVEKFDGKITNINNTRTGNLQYPQLSSIYHGDLPVSPSEMDTQKRPEFALIDSYYTAEVTLENFNYPLKAGQTGILQVDGPWRSKLGSLLRYTYSILWRESGF